MANENVTQETEEAKNVLQRRSAMMTSESTKEISSRVFMTPNMRIANGKLRMCHMNNGTSAMTNGR